MSMLLTMSGPNSQRFATTSRREKGSSGASASKVLVLAVVRRAGIWFASRREIAVLSRPMAVRGGGTDE